MTDYYLQVVKPGVCICLDTDVGYYHNFEVGDVLLITMDIHSGPTLKHKGFSISDPHFILDWDKVQSVRLSISGCLLKGVMIDMTVSINRELKLNQIGI